MVLLLSGLFLFEGVTWALCRQRGIDVVTYERAFLKETLVFHRGAPAGFYDFTDDWATAERPLEPAETPSSTATSPVVGKARRSTSSGSSGSDPSSEGRAGWRSCSRT